VDAVGIHGGLLLRVDRVDGQFRPVLALEGHGFVGEVLGGLVPGLHPVELLARVALDEVDLHVKLPVIADRLREAAGGTVHLP